MALRLVDRFLVLLRGRRSTRGRSRLAYDVLVAVAEPRRPRAVSPGRSYPSSTK